MRSSGWRPKLPKNASSKILIEAEIEKIEYHPTLNEPLPQVTLDDFQNGRAFKHSRFVVEYAPLKTAAVSCWTSPKRTRTYPYARVYDTLSYPVRLTIIPFVKDEGKAGDLDYLQWDTVSLMSLLGVYVIPAYYADAKPSSRRREKITAQKFDYAYLTERLQTFISFNQSDAAHWNMNELQENGVRVAQQAKLSYAEISSKTHIPLHNLQGIDQRIIEMLADIENFKNRSRKGAQSAQAREGNTLHASEVTREDKALLTIKNFIGGYYYWTADEAVIKGDAVIIVEKKHSTTDKLPSRGDVKDALVKMILFANLTRAYVSGKEYKPRPAIGLTSALLNGACHSQMTKTEIAAFFAKNALNVKQRQWIQLLFHEANTNHFMLAIGSPALRVSDLITT